MLSSMWWMSVWSLCYGSKADVSKGREHFKSLMYLEEQGTVTDPGPYWVTKQPWKVSKETLVDNKPAVLGVMNSTRPS